MKMKNWRQAVVSVVSVAVLNTGMIQAAQAGIVDTGAMIQTSRDASMLAIQAQLAREDVRAQLTRFGVEATAIDARLGAMSDSELATLSKRMQETPAGGDGLLAVIGLTFVVLLILELVGVIDIFKRNP
jgi:hypothetical protein